MATTAAKSLAANYFEFVTLLRLRCVAAIVLVLVVGSGTFWWVHFSKYLNILV